MSKQLLTRDQAIEIAGLAAVDAVDRENCEATNRVLDDCDGRVEFASSVFFHDARLDCDACLTAIYFQDADDVADCDDLSDLGWDVAGYEIA